MRAFTLYFCYVSNEERRTVPLTNELGQEITMVVEAETKTAAMADPKVAEFCQLQGNDCRIRRIQ